MSEGFRNFVGWAIILPVYCVIVGLLWLPTFGNSVEWSQTIRLAIFRWMWMGRDGIKYYSE